MTPCLGGERRIDAIAVVVMLSVALLGLLGSSTARAQTNTTPSAHVTFADATQHIQLTGSLYRPEGPGPFPAVVFLHGCAGILPKHHWWARQLRRWGYVALLVDSLTPRNLANVCAEADPRRLPPLKRVPDAYGALQYLQRQPVVDADRIGIMGWSHGGATVLTAINRLLVEVMDLPRHRFRAAVAWYPFCFGTRMTSPLLILIGEQDDWTPAALCVQMLRDLEPDSAPVSLKVYPGAYHSFDRLRSARIIYHGHRLERHADAVAQAQAEVKQFLARYLAPRPPSK
jgi:dienelactone hydrolase